MVVISAGMQKSGSAYAYNLINDVLIEAGHSNAREVKEKYHLESVMQWHNNNIGALSNSLLLKLLKIGWKEGTFAVKTHEGPTSLHNALIQMGMIKTIYTYRDPRDVLLSAQDHGKKILAEGKNITFAKMVEFEDALKAVKNWGQTYKDYAKNKGVFTIRYEDILEDPLAIMKEVCVYLKLDIPSKNLVSIIKKYDRNNPNADMTGLHYNKAVAKRYEQEMTEQQLARFREELGDVILQMGYEL